MKGSITTSMYCDEPPSVGIHSTSNGPWVSIRLGGFNSPLMTMPCADAIALTRALLAALPEASDEERLREALSDLVFRIEEPGCAEHTLGDFIHGIGLANARAALEPAR